MYVFNKITVNPQLPKRIEKLSEIANNLWWSWNTEFLRLFKRIDIDVWYASNKNPVKFLKAVSQEKLEAAKMHVEEHIGCTTIANKFNCGKNRILLWSKKYQEGGEEALRYETRGRSKTGRTKNKKFNSIEEELEYVKAERDILKKTLEILNKQGKK